jgi:hypothetical protein
MRLNGTCTDLVSFIFNIHFRVCENCNLRYATYVTILIYVAFMNIKINYYVLVDKDQQLIKDYLQQYTKETRCNQSRSFQTDLPSQQCT